MSLGLAIQYLRPDLQPCVDYTNTETSVNWITPGPRPSDDELRAAMLPAAQAAKRAAIKQAARQIILGRYPEWRQANLTARAVELVSLGQTSGPEWQQMQSIWAWIKAVRAHSDLLEADVAACTTVAAVDAVQLSGWPE